jgi:hypothetical protein
MRKLSQLEILEYAIAGARSMWLTRGMQVETYAQLIADLDELEKRQALAMERRKENECALSVYGPLPA